MTALDGAIRARLAIFGNDVQGNAIRTVLDMKPPQMDDLVPDAQERALVRVGWIAAKAQAVSAIARALGVDVPAPGGGS